MDDYTYSIVNINETNSGRQTEMDKLPQRLKELELKPPAPISVSMEPHDHLCWSMFNLAFCNICCALPAMFYTIRTRDAKREGMRTSAEVYSRRSCYFNFAATFFVAICILIFMFVGISFSSRSSTSSVQHTTSTVKPPLDLSFSYYFFTETPNEIGN